MLIKNFNVLKMSLLPLYLSLYFSFFFNMLNNFLFKKIDIMMLNISLLTNFIMIYVFLTYLKKEVIYMGLYSMMKQNINVLGFILFITSELMVFVSLFWSYIHNAYTPNQYLGNYWPPKGIETSNPTSMIIFGTAILLNSSLIIMYGHNNILNSNKMKTMKYLIITILMGLMFMDMQAVEMSNFILKLQFNFNDSIFSNSFLFTTSLHATHVLFGVMALIFSYFILLHNMNNMKLTMSLEMSIWYWHFVDYIWIGVFTIFYYLNN